MALASVDTIRNYAELTKPRLLPLVLLTGLPVLGMAAAGPPSVALGALVLLGIALAAASANTLNAYIERDADALMERTQDRPLPAGRIAPRAALVFGLALAVVSTLLLWAVSGPAAAGSASRASLFYVFVYTLWAEAALGLERRDRRRGRRRGAAHRRRRRERPASAPRASRSSRSSSSGSRPTSGRSRCTGSATTQPPASRRCRP